MVTINSYEVRKNKQNESFLVLVLVGGVEIIQTSSGGFRAVVRKATIPCSFDETIAKNMVGQQIAGEIVRVSSQPYTLTNKKTGEVLTLTHTYRFQPTGATLPIEAPVLDNVDQEIEEAE